MSYQQIKMLKKVFFVRSSPANYRIDCFQNLIECNFYLKESSCKIWARSVQPFLRYNALKSVTPTVLAGSGRAGSGRVGPVHVRFRFKMKKHEFWYFQNFSTTRWPGGGPRPWRGSSGLNGNGRRITFQAHFGNIWQVIKSVLIGIFERSFDFHGLWTRDNKI